VCDQLFPPLLHPLEITYSRFKVLDRILETAQTPIAVVTKKTPYLASLMIVVYRESADFAIPAPMSLDCPADRAFPFLGFKKRSELLG
jgi:hypothetical protein